MCGVIVIPELQANFYRSAGDFDQRTNGYMAFVLWAVAALAVFRFIGSVTYRILSIFTGS